VAPACLGTPSTPEEGGIEGGGGVVWGLADPDDHPAAPSAWGEGAGSMARQADPSQLESERELCPHTTGYSSELRA
jgi:hypothetical protein